MTTQTPSVEIETNAPIPTWFGVGGRADRLARPETIEQLIECVRLDPDLRVLGDGANLLVDDAGVRELVVDLSRGVFKDVAIHDETGFVIAGAGARLPQLITECVRRGLGGLETGGGCASAGIGIDGGEPAEMRDGLSGGLVQRVAPCHIAGQRERLLADVPGKVCQCLFRAREQRDVPARLCRSTGGGGADAGRGAGDEQRLGDEVSWF